MKYINLIWIFFVGVQFGKDSFKAESDHTIRFFIKDSQTRQGPKNYTALVSYGGYTTTSNYEGAVVLPRKTQGHQLFLLITPLQSAQFNLLNNISRWTIPTDQPTQLYQLNLNNQHGKQPFWQVKPIDLPISRHVPLHTIVVLGHPDELTLQSGNFPTLSGEQFLLPNLSINLTSQQPKVLAHALNNHPFFGKLETAYELTPYGYATIQGR